MSTDSDGISGLAKGAGVVLLGSVFAKPLGLLGTVLIVRSLPPDVFGQLSLAFTITSVIASLLLLGIPEGVTRLSAAAPNSHKRNRIVTTGIIFAALGGIVGASVLYLFREDVANFMGNEQLGEMLILFIPFLIGQPVAQVFIGTLRGLKLSRETTLIRDVGGRVVPLVVLLAFLLAGEPFLGTVVYWISTPFAILFIAAIYGRQHDVISSFSLDNITLSSISKLTQFSWPLALEGVFVLAMSSLDILMIGFFLSSGEVGLYRAIQPVVGVILIALSSIVFIYLPLATEYYETRDYVQLETLLQTSAKWASTATYPLVVTLVLLPDEIISVLFGSEYVGASTALIALTIGTFLRVFVGPNGATIKAIDMSRVDLISSIIGVITNVILNILLIPIYGITGAAVATAVGYLVFNAVELVVIYIHAKITPFTWNSVKPMPVTIAAAFLVTHFGMFDQESLLFLIPFGAFTTGVHALAFYLTGCVESEDLQALRIAAEKFRSTIN